MSFNSRNDIVLNQQLKVQELVLPYTIRASNTAASVVLTPANPAVLFLKSSGVDQITSNIPTGDTVPGFTQVTIAEGATNQTGAMVNLISGDKVVQIVEAFTLCKNIAEGVQGSVLVQEPNCVLGVGTVSQQTMFFYLKTASSNLSTTPVAQTGNSTAGSNVVLSLGAQPAVGQLVVGANFPANTIVIAQSGSQMTLSQNATVTQTGAAFTYYNWFDGALVVRYTTAV